MLWLSFTASAILFSAIKLTKPTVNCLLDNKQLNIQSQQLASEGSGAFCCKSSKDYSYSVTDF